ncbi:TWiK family of potassium channels protein 18 [Papilio machaon]|uniref:TWiK family of potassium channels protein 18 n=1 Tax=Papilio machaon TaxID=76193 RepID=A0A0N1IAQ6_PAPMA|nr:TWiK family of potassium channels protein 18 [Papilio machaon]
MKFLTERLNVLYERNWTRLVHEQLRKFESSVVAAARHADTQPELTIDNKWTFSGALIYCITLITTIGYGNVSPRTAAGRAATVAYAAAGVPLTLACLAGLGASLARLARIAWLKTNKNKIPNTWRKEGELENHFQLHEQQRLLPQPAQNNQYTSFPPRPHRYAGTVKARAGEKGQYSQVFEKAPASPRAATLGRIKRSALSDEPHSSGTLQTQTLDRKKNMNSMKCMATIHGAGRGRGRSPVQRPRGVAIEQLIAEECGDIIMTSCREELDESEDADEIICPHDTPSRVPLIWNEEHQKVKSCAVPSCSTSTKPHSSGTLQTQTLDRKRNMNSMKCMATIHGVGRGRGRSPVQRPRGVAIEQLIAEECGDIIMNSCREEVDESEDADEIICPHDTPSRVPLIWNEEHQKVKSCAVPSCSTSTSVPHQNHGIEHCHIPVGIVLFLLLAYICVGATIFSVWENWSFLDATYFCFIALATIGFGDFVPTSFLTSKHSTESSKNEYIQMIACCAYLVFGLILIAMSFSLLQDEVVARCSQLANSLGITRQ